MITIKQKIGDIEIYHDYSRGAENTKDIPFFVVNLQFPEDETKDKELRRNQIENKRNPILKKEIQEDANVNSEENDNSITIKDFSINQPEELFKTKEITYKKNDLFRIINPKNLNETNNDVFLVLLNDDVQQQNPYNFNFEVTTKNEFQLKEFLTNGIKINEGIGVEKKPNFDIFLNRLKSTITQEEYKEEFRKKSPYFYYINLLKLYMFLRRNNGFLDFYITLNGLKKEKTTLRDIYAIMNSVFLYYYYFPSLFYEKVTHNTSLKFPWVFEFDSSSSELNGINFTLPSGSGKESRTKVLRTYNQIIPNMLFPDDKDFFFIQYVNLTNKENRETNENYNKNIEFLKSLYPFFPILIDQSNDKNPNDKKTFMLGIWINVRAHDEKYQNNWTDYDFYILIFFLIPSFIMLYNTYSLLYSLVDDETKEEQNIIVSKNRLQTKISKKCQDINNLFKKTNLLTINTPLQKGLNKPQINSTILNSKFMSANESAQETIWKNRNDYMKKTTNEIEKEIRNLQVYIKTWIEKFKLLNFS